MSERWPGHPAKLDEPEGTAVDEVEEGAVSSDGAAEEQELPDARRAACVRRARHP